MKLKTMFVVLSMLVSMGASANFGFSTLSDAINTTFSSEKFANAVLCSDAAVISGRDSSKFIEISEREVSRVADIFDIKDMEKVDFMHKLSFLFTQRYLIAAHKEMYDSYEKYGNADNTKRAYDLANEVFFQNCTID